MGLLDKLKKTIAKRKKATIYANKRSGLEKLCDVEYGNEQELMNDISSCLEQAKQAGYPIEKVKTLTIVSQDGQTVSITNPFYQGKASSSTRRGQKEKSESLSTELLEQVMNNTINMLVNTINLITNAYTKVGDAMINAVSNVTSKVIEGSIVSSKKIKNVIEGVVEETEKVERGVNGYKVLSDVASVATFLMDVANNPDKYKKALELLKGGGGETK